MQTILDILQKSTDYLEKKGVPSPRVDAEWLLAEALKMNRMKLLLEAKRPLCEKEIDAIRPLILRRGKREPLQYILGSQPFVELDLKTDSRALIPRPETEELIYLIEGRVDTPKRVLDMGTGTGAIALSMAKLYPEAQIYGSDVSEDALSLAEENGKANDLASRVKWIQSNWYEAIEEKFDLIVSNPPYLTEKEWEQAEPEVKEFEPAQALWSKEDGLADIIRIIEDGPSYLERGGWLFLETGISQRDSLEDCLRKASFDRIEVLSDFSQRDRYVCAQLA